jgi:glycosyltransferase involved in cell wall biosynthesis
MYEIKTRQEGIIKMAKPLVSVITPCFNGEKFVDRYFQSILEQTYDNIELIFINDGSEDKTEEIALSYSEKLKDKGVKFIYEYQKNEGQAAALNRGLKLFTGEYLTCPDSDDVMTPDCIAKKVDFLESHKDYDMVRSNGSYYDMKTGVTKRICDAEKASDENILKDILLLKTYGCCGCYMITKKVLEKAYPDRNIMVSRVGQNWQLLVPAASYSKCGYIDEDLYIVYEHNDSHSRSIQSFSKQIERWNGFTDILLDAIDRSDCDREYYKRLVLENRARNQFYYAIPIKDKQLIKDKYKDLKKYGKATLKETLLYLKNII